MIATPVQNSAQDHVHMARALYVATRARNSCDPNPRVGCVIEAGGKIVGEAWHQRAGDSHAEIIALNQAGEQARGATVFVTLEPCCHTGKTGPCTAALIDAGVERVVVAMNDPNPQVAGGGHRALSTAGIKVSTGLLSAQSEQINRGFVSRMRNGRPFVCSKIAASRDGRVALPEAKQLWISSQQSRDDVQQMRAQVSAILTGVNTVIADNPRMTVRLEKDNSWQQPMRVILDSRLRTPVDAKILHNKATTVIMAREDAPADRVGALERVGAKVMRVAANGDGLQLNEVMAELAALELNEVLVESGPKLNSSLLRAGLLDEIVVYQAAHTLGDDARPMFESPRVTDMANRPEFDLVSTRPIGDDWRKRFVPGSV
ncbi:MAG: bifunctional diaminohydroxyphosphoribosylaminopyrimidine deaminase/5-amino-6-(5-phosphoribosylamino)uracil reductase RibD [Gammaproteobacteria bacterium]|nr:bifunctional diaminohydroxyphosphoribosylaminopyrimidine deaminase/5-amino-6-(5-phosphoribosylamino)uracil reductase RibD [Gammaproteobacteria bacterium]